MQEPEAFSNAPSASPNRSENPILVAVTRVREGVRMLLTEKSDPKNLLRERIIYVESHYINRDTREGEGRTATENNLWLLPLSPKDQERPRYLTHLVRKARM
jgi:hypothetical protein